MDGRPILSLPQRHERSTTVEFPEDQLEVYDAMSATVATRFQTLLQEQGQSAVRNNMLALMGQLSPLRQACSGGPLLSLRDLTLRPSRDKAMKGLGALDSMPQEEVDTSNQQCPVCLDEFEDPVLTKCNHLFCYPCITVSFYQRLLACPLILSF
jgi:hypothetical protein